MDETKKSCVVCGNLKKDGKHVVGNPSLENIDSLCEVLREHQNRKNTNVSSFQIFANEMGKWSSTKYSVMAGDWN